MDFVVGRIPRTNSSTEKNVTQSLGIEARVLHMREPRRRNRDAVEGEERRRDQGTDPPGARVLVVLVPEAYKLPENLDSGEYRVFLRFVRK
ncbi:MAG: hypothetical protein Q9Q40_08485 [Acidobacteriota bacterium]|nr:hypothetical protein [Acidobacteriota bacterium]MDQ7086321.1 hypothetical protein [Acidobacteriota bacterium]